MSSLTIIRAIELSISECATINSIWQRGTCHGYFDSINTLETIVVALAPASDNAIPTKVQYSNQLQ